MQPINTNPVQQNALPTDTLALNDIHVPEQISNYPIAYGWWILAVFAVLLIIFIIIKARKNRQYQQVKKQALAQLKSNEGMSNNDLISLLKWAAMHYFSRAQLAQLYGESLQHFLLEQLPEKYHTQFTQLSEQAFKTQYQAHAHNESDTDFKQATQLWLNQALPPKKLAKSTENNLPPLQQQNEGAN